MGMVALSAQRMFPPRPAKRRVRGVRKPQIAFRCPDYLKEYIEAMEAQGYTQTEVVIKLLEFSKDFNEEMGQDSWELDRRAYLQKLTAGKMAARFSMRGMECDGVDCAQLKNHKKK